MRGKVVHYAYSYREQRRDRPVDAAATEKGDREKSAHVSAQVPNPARTSDRRWLGEDERDQLLFQLFVPIRQLDPR